MRRVLWHVLPLLTFVTLFLFSVLPTFAKPIPTGNGFVHGTGHAHFAADETFATLNADGTLTVFFTEAGLGHVAVATPYTLTATATAAYDCVDAAGVVIASSGDIVATTTGSVTSGIHNGANVLAVVLAPPGPGAFICPAGTTLRLVSVLYSDVIIMDTLRGISFVLPGPYSLVLV